MTRSVYIGVIALAASLGLAGCASAQGGTTQSSPFAEQHRGGGLRVQLCQRLRHQWPVSALRRPNDYRQSYGTGVAVDSSQKVYTLVEAEQLSRPVDGSRTDPAVIGVWVDVAAAHPALVAQSAADQLDEVIALFDQAVSARESRARTRTDEELAERAKKGESRQLLMDVILPVLGVLPHPTSPCAFLSRLACYPVDRS